MLCGEVEVPGQARDDSANIQKLLTHMHNGYGISPDFVSSCPAGGFARDAPGSAVYYAAANRLTAAQIRPNAAPARADMCRARRNPWGN